MATTGPSAGRKGDVAISNAVSSDYTTATYVHIERVNSPALPGTLKKADASSNDSGGDEEHVVTWRSGKLTFEVVAAAEHPTGQSNLFTAFVNGEIRAWKYCPTGLTTGDPRYRFLGSIDDIEDMAPKDGVRAYKVTVTRTGGFTRDTNP